MICKECGKTFHYCSSCDIDIMYDEKCCSTECFEKTEECYFWKAKLESFYKSLSLFQKDDFYQLYNEGILEWDAFRHIADNIIIDPELLEADK